VKKDSTDTESTEEISVLKTEIATLKKAEVESRALIDAIRKNEERYRLIFESASEGIMVIQNEVIVLANPTLLRTAGIPIEDLLSKPFYQFVHPDDRPIIRDRYRKRLSGEPVETGYDFRFVRADGTVRWLQITSRLITWENKPASLNFVIDVTKRKIVEQQLESAIRYLQAGEERYKTILNTMQEAFYEVDLKGNFSFFNVTTSINLGYSHEEVKGMNFRNIVSEEDAEKIMKTYNEVYRTGRPVTGFDFEIITRDGRKIPVEASVALKRDASGQAVGFTGVTRDITDRKKAEEKLRYISIHDPLTGVHNRLMFEEELERMESGRFDPVAIVVCDLDGLKALNDTRGHVAGDKLIIAAANLLKGHFRSSDVVARIGGDEFAVLMPHCDPMSIESICNRLRQSTGKIVDGVGVPLLMSLGYAVRANGGRSLQDVLSEADKRMYLEKDKNRSVAKRLLESHLFVK